MTDVKLTFTADYLETCNCIGFPSDGTCEALVADLFINTQILQN